MTKLDKALALIQQDPKAQPLFYDLFLNSLFFIPILENKELQGDVDGSLPLLVEADGDSYLMLFDTIKRLTDWADDETKYLALPGHAVTEMSLPKLCWALNYGSEHQKLFAPEEIKWLKDVVRQAKADEQGQAEPQTQKEEA